MNKRAALEMSVQSIVVFVLAFIVMGLIIGVINAMFGQITTQVDLIPSPGIELGGNPTPERPFLVQNGEVNIPLNRDTTVYFGVYNTLEEPQEAGSNWWFNVTECAGFGSDLKPNIQATRYVHERTLNYGEIMKFQTVMRIPSTATVTPIPSPPAPLTVPVRRGDRFTCYGQVTALNVTGSPTVPDFTKSFAFGSFILTVQ